MRITAIRVWKVDLPVADGRYAWADGKFVETFDSTVVEIETDEGVTGCAECCPLGPAYLPAFAAGVRTGLAEVGRHLIGCNPLDIGAINRVLDQNLKGHAYVKSPLDIACWDILGKVSGLPLYMLLGGKAQSSVALYRAISQASPPDMARSVKNYRAEGYHKFQLKVGGNPDDDIERIIAVRDVLEPTDVLVADANTGWTQHEAARVVDAVRDVDVYIEQPCPGYEECLSIRRRTAKPFILDETVDSVAVLLRAICDDAMDVINLKISKVGGLTRARLIRDLCVERGIPMTIEDSWGGDIGTTTIAQLAQSTPEEFSFSSTDFNSYVTVDNAVGGAKRDGGSIAASDRPGLGVEPDYDALTLDFEIGRETG